MDSPNSVKKSKQYVSHLHSVTESSGSKKSDSSTANESCNIAEIDEVFEDNEPESEISPKISSVQ